MNKKNKDLSKIGIETIKPKLMYYSDCDYFAGSENMISILTSDLQINSAFEVVFAFRWNALYEEGARIRLPKFLRKIPVRLITMQWIFRNLNCETSGYFKYLRALLYIICFPIVIFYQYFSLVVILLREKPQILHVNNGGFPGALSCRLAVLAARTARVRKVFLTVNNRPVSYIGLYRKLDYLIDQLALRCCKAIITASTQNLEAMRSVLGVSSSKLRVIPNSVERREVIKTKSETLESLGLPGNVQLIFGVVSEMTARKGHRFLINAIRRGVIEGRWRPGEVVILIEGDGPIRSELEKLVGLFDLEDFILFVGRFERIFELLEVIDVLVLPSIENEDLPNIVSEAMMIGKPVIASRVGGTPFQVDHGRTGFLFEPGNIEALIEAIDFMLHNRSMVISMGKESQLDFELKFSKNYVISQYLQLYSTDCAV
jgi:glycosyltransferase involved in cell wall biosynthesis